MVLVVALLFVPQVTDGQTMMDACSHVSVGTQTSPLDMMDAAIQHPPDTDAVLKDHSYMKQPCHAENSSTSETNDLNIPNEGFLVRKDCTSSENNGSALSNELSPPQESSFPHHQELLSLVVQSSGSVAEMCDVVDTTPVYLADDEASISDPQTKSASDESGSSSDETSNSPTTSSDGEEPLSSSDKSESGNEEFTDHESKESSSEESDLVESGWDDCRDGSASEKYVLHDNKSDSERSASEVSTSGSGEAVHVGFADTDPDWTISGEESSSSSETEESKEQKYCHDRKFIVFESQIDSLFYSMHCEKCQGPVHNIQKRVVGSMVCVSCICSEGHEFYKWESQPKIGKAAVGNLIGAAAILFTGTHLKMSANFFI